MLIGLCGPARSGKSTLSAHLVRSHGFVEVALADPIKDALAAMFRVDRAEIERDKTAASPAGPSWRALMQSLGTDWGRNVNNGIWVNLAMARIYDAMTAGRSVVVSDVRFDNEARAIMGAGGYVVRVTRACAEKAGGIYMHPSEAGVSLLLSSWHVRNDWSMADAFEQIDDAVSLFRCQGHARSG